MLKRLVNEAICTLTITNTGPLLIKSGYPTLTGPDMTPVLTTRHGEKQVFIPGSSLKGVFRSHIEKVIRTVRPSEVVVPDPFNKKAHDPEESCSDWFNRMKKERDNKKGNQNRNEDDTSLDNALVYKVSDPVSRLFGSTYFIGRVSISDAYLSKANTPRLPTEQRDGVGIDRLTGGAAHGAKFELEVVSAGTTFQTEILLRNFECWQLGAILLVVQDMEDELLRLGSGKSRGLGAVKGAVEAITIHHLGSGHVSQRPANEIWGLGHFLGDGSYGTKPDDVLTIDPAPAMTNKHIRYAQEFTGEALQELKRQSIQEFVRRMDTFPCVQELRQELQQELHP